MKYRLKTTDVEAVRVANENILPEGVVRTDAGLKLDDGRGNLYSVTVGDWIITSKNFGGEGIRRWSHNDLNFRAHYESDTPFSREVNEAYERYATHQNCLEHSSPYFSMVGGIDKAAMHADAMLLASEMVKLISEG